MLTYEYQCKACGRRFERLQSITEPPLARCPECDGGVERLISGGSGFLLKGSGGSRSGCSDGSCSLDRTGGTCCGLGEPCSNPLCGGDS